MATYIFTSRTVKRSRSFLDDGRAIRWVARLERLRSRLGRLAGEGARRKRDRHARKVRVRDLALRRSDEPRTYSEETEARLTELNLRMTPSWIRSALPELVHYDELRVMAALDIFEACIFEKEAFDAKWEDIPRWQLPPMYDPTLWMSAYLKLFPLDVAPFEAQHGQIKQPESEDAGVLAARRESPNQRAPPRVRPAGVG